MRDILDPVLKCTPYGKLHCIAACR
jgi:hypothetical protein